MMALSITEDWVRERVNLKHNNLEDVRSLALPGTYHEKITCLGDSLRKFTRLLTLDLSRNAVENLGGLETLKMMEKLNLYYNNVSSLKELYKLRYNQKLQEMDLRLNPVARNEPDYRLFMIHMLPSLRRLDDRAVRDNERKAALMHFTTDQAAELTEHLPKPPVPESTTNPRAEHVKTLAKPTSTLDNDDVAMMELMSKKSGALGSTKPITGSKTKAADLIEYTSEAVRQMDIAGVGMEHIQTSAQMYSTNQVTSEGTSLYGIPAASTGKSGNQPPPTHGMETNSETDFQDKYPIIQNLVSNRASSQPFLPSESEVLAGQNSQTSQIQKKNRVQFTEDPNLKFQDELEAYTSYKAQGHFTPHPDVAGEKTEGKSDDSSVSDPAPPSQPLYLDNDRPGNRGVELYGPESSYSAHKDNGEDSVSTQPTEPQRPRSPTPDSMLPSDALIQGSMELGGEAIEFIKKVSDMADKYWNGAKSLLKNQRFKNQMMTLLRGLQSSSGDTDSGSDSSLQFQLSRVRNKLNMVEEDNARLREKMVNAVAEVHTSNPELDNADENKLKSTLIRAQRDLTILRGRLQRSIEENRNLEDQIAGLKSQHTSVDPTDAGSIRDIEMLRSDNSRLKTDIEGMSRRLKQSQQMQELAGMLQESHKSLVQTNDHLLHELDDTRQRHQAEIKQLTWSYDQLKQSTGYLQAASSMAATYGSQGSTLSGNPGITGTASRARDTVFTGNT